MIVVELGQPPRIVNPVPEELTAEMYEVCLTPREQNLVQRIGELVLPTLPDGMGVDKLEPPTVYGPSPSMTTRILAMTILVRARIAEIEEARRPHTTLKPNGKNSWIFDPEDARLLREQESLDRLLKRLGSGLDQAACGI
jgi:hypothetical protein